MIFVVPTHGPSMWPLHASHSMALDSQRHSEREYLETEFQVNQVETTTFLKKNLDLKVTHVHLCCILLDTWKPLRPAEPRFKVRGEELRHHLSLTGWYHFYVESKKYSKLVNKKKRSWLRYGEQTIGYHWVREGSSDIGLGEWEVQTIGCKIKGI